MQLPAKTEYALTYKATDNAEVREGQLYFIRRRPIIILFLIMCTFAALYTASKTSLLAFLTAFCCNWLGFALALFLISLVAAFLAVMMITTSSRLNLACTTVMDETGISDKYWGLKFAFRWHQIHEIEMKNGNIYVAALVNGIHIPASAFATSDEARDFFALAKRYHAQAQQKKNGIAQEIFAGNPDLFLEAYYEDEEAKWREIEDKHNEQNPEPNVE